MKEALSDTAVLPFDVRFALQHRQGMLGAEEVLSLARQGSEYVSLYLTLKALDDNDERQLDLLEKVIQQYGDGQRPGPDIMAPFVRPDMRVNAVKLGQIYKCGIFNWEEQFRNMFAQSRESEVFVLAYSPLSALGPILEHTLYENRPLHILKPNKVAQGLNPIGFSLTRNTITGQVEATAIPRDFVRSENAVLVDDIARSGRTLDNIQSFWRELGSFAAKELLITDLRAVKF